MIMLSFSVRVFISEAYVAIGNLNAPYKDTFSGSEMLRFFQITFLSLPKACAARTVLRVTSSVVLGLQLSLFHLEQFDISFVFAPLIFMPHFSQLRSNSAVDNSKMVAISVVSSYIPGIPDVI